MQVHRHVVALEPCCQVACHTIVRRAVDAVGGEVHLNEPVVVHAVVLGCWRAHDSVVGEHDDAVVTRADAYLVLGTYHAQRLLAAHLRPLDDKLLVAVVERRAQRGNYHFLACRHIGGSTHNLDRGGTITQIHCGDVQVVTVRMFYASKHLAHYETAKSSANGLHALQTAHFKTQRGQCLAHLFGGQLHVDVALEPLVGNIHKLSVFSLFRLAYTCYQTAKLQILFRIPPPMWLQVPQLVQKNARNAIIPGWKVPARDKIMCGCVVMCRFTLRRRCRRGC